jgi:hypothetical protein
VKRGEDGLMINRWVNWGPVHFLKYCRGRLELCVGMKSVYECALHNGAPACWRMI